MNRTRSIFVATFVAVCVGIFPASPPDACEACSVFSLSSGGDTVLGQNLDYDYFPGWVVVNTRGVRKTILPWKGHWPDSAKRETVSWVSRYGSITFTCYGRDFIDGGMNEAGLMVDEANLTAGYPPDDGRPGVSCPQWMQYQLDNFATVDEVLAHLDELRPDGEGWHYLIADRMGNCAVIEYRRGKAVVYSGASVEVCAITNTTHEQALSHIPMDKAFGGDIDIAAGTDSYARFVRMAALIRDYDPGRDGTAVAEYAFRILDDVSVDDTIRSVVYDAAHRRVLWKTRDNPKLRWLDFDALDTSDASPVRVVDVEAGGPGDVSGRLAAYSADANRALVEAVLGTDAGDPDVEDELKSRGLTLEEALDLIGEHPARVPR